MNLADAVILPTLNDSTRATMHTDAANARAEARIGAALAPYWDAVHAANASHKRADIVNNVLRASGLWKDTPQKTDGVRTPYGNVWQRFAARYDAAVKRAAEPTDKPVVLRVSLSGDGGGTTVIAPDHPLYTVLANLFEGADVLA